MLVFKPYLSEQDVLDEPLDVGGLFTIGSHDHHEFAHEPIRPTRRINQSRGVTFSAVSDQSPQMKPATYQELGIPDSYCFESFIYVPSGNIGVCVFSRKQEPQVSRIFWRRAQQDSYTAIPVENEHYSFDSCVPSVSSDFIYYSVMHHRKPEGRKNFGGYWVSLNKFCLSSLKEEILVSESDFIAMTGKAESWISRIVHVSPSESEIDVIAGIGDPRNEGINVMEYSVYRIDLVRRQITHRLPMPGVFI